MKKLQEALKNSEKLQKMREAFEKGKKAWEETSGKTWSAPDPLKWIKAWKEGDSYDRELQTCFAAYAGPRGSPASQQGYASAFSRVSQFPLTKSAMLDNGSSHHIVNDKSLFIELHDESETDGIFSGESIMEYRQVGIAEIPIRKPGGR